MPVPRTPPSQMLCLPAGANGPPSRYRQHVSLQHAVLSFQEGSLGTPRATTYRGGRTGLRVPSIGHGWDIWAMWPSSGRRRLATAQRPIAGAHAIASRRRATVICRENYQRVVQHPLRVERCSHIADALVDCTEHARECAPLLVRDCGVVGLRVSRGHLQRAAGACENSKGPTSSAVLLAHLCRRVHPLKSQVEEEWRHGRIVRADDTHRFFGEDGR